MNHDNLHESLHCVWYEHGNYFSSRIREEYSDDAELHELCEEFEDAWRNLYESVLEKTEEEKIKERIKEEVLYPIVKEEMKSLL